MVFHNLLFVGVSEIVVFDNVLYRNVLFSDNVFGVVGVYLEPDFQDRATRRMLGNSESAEMARTSLAALRRRI